MNLSPQSKRYAERLRELIEEGKAVAKLEKDSSVGPFFQGEDKIRVQAWLAKVSNILSLVFGPESSQLRHFQEVLPKGGIARVEHSYDVHPITGILAGALDDLEKGFLIGQEFLMAAEIFDSILEQAKHLNQNGYKDPAAVLVRVVLEDSLKRIAREAGIDENQKASRINDELKSAGKYPQPQWRFIQAWLDIGNAAAHGKFTEYDQDAVSKMIEGVAQFLAITFQK